MGVYWGEMENIQDKALRKWHLRRLITEAVNHSEMLKVSYVS